MKKNPFSGQGSKVLPLLLIAFIVTTITLLNACGGNSKKAPQAFSGEAPKGGAASISCLKLTRAQLQTWVDSGWTKPGTEGAVSEILFQFYSPDAGATSSNLHLIAYPGSSSTSLKRTGKQVLEADTACTGLTITGGMILSNIQLALSTLDIFNNDGTLKEFDYLRLTPVRFSKDNDYISFNVEKVAKGVLMSGAAVQLPPCPPYCCPPVCPE